MRTSKTLATLAFALLAILPAVAAPTWLTDLDEAKKADALEHEIEEQLGPVLDPTLSKKDLAGAEAAMNKFFKEKGLTGDFLVRMTLNVRVGITAECKPGDHDAVLKVVDEVATLTTSKEVLAEIADLRERVLKVRDQDAERKKTTSK